MRIDDINRAQPTEATKPDQAVGRPKSEFGAHQPPDQVDISALAESVSSADPRRVEQLRLEVEKGTYKVSADAVAKSIIEEHLKR